ncbi:hypothetical protein CA265_01890 [Sphingobacteriaceae bacterium GW460-11-11-14-LB5]|nr:hypothetical protein CA265_01890 [Sphingobacteriaceae bacterium GW460-11-11-14-LB5]
MYKKKIYLIIAFFVVIISLLNIKDFYTKIAVPVDGAKPIINWNQKSFWYYPWGELGSHRGIDIFGELDAPILSPVSGIVIKSGFSTNGGNYNYLDQKDSISIIEESLHHILGKKVLPKEYYNQPLQIIIPENLQHTEIFIDGKKCILLPINTDVKQLMKGMDIFKPITLVELGDLKLDNKLIFIELIFRATGHNFLLELKKDKSGRFKIINVRERTI